MSKQILFIHGAGEGAYHADAPLVDSLRHTLGSEYEIRYPAMPDEENAPYELWRQQIEAELAGTERIILVGHSVGASILVKYLDDTMAQKPIAGIFLLAAPYWGGDGWRYEGYEKLELSSNIATRIPQSTPIYLYHSRDDEVVPFAHLALYAQKLPQAIRHELNQGGHQLSNDLIMIASDIKNISTLCKK